MEPNKQKPDYNELETTALQSIADDLLDHMEEYDEQYDLFDKREYSNVMTQTEQENVCKYFSTAYEAIRRANIIIDYALIRYEDIMKDKCNKLSDHSEQSDNSDK